MSSKDERAKIAVVADTGKIEFAVSNVEELFKDFNTLETGDFKELVFTNKDDVD